MPAKGNISIQPHELHMPLNKIALFQSAALIVALGLSACDNGSAQVSVPQAPTVAVSEIRAAPVPLRFQYAGRVAAFREVEVRARVSGILQEKSFVEGATVKEGDVLFRIDPAPYEAALDRAKAQLKEAQAQVYRTQRDAERATTLLQRGFGTEKARDDSVAAHELAQAGVASAEAQVKTAKINFGYTTATAPIAGITSLRVLPEGSLVATSQTDSLLTRISQLDPVYVHFSFTDTEATEIRQLIDSGEGTGPADGKLQVKISFGDGKIYDRGGYVDFTDSNLDLQTGTVRARAIIPNPESKLRPGQFVRVSVEGITRHETIVIPQAAVMQGAQGQFVYAVDTENKASIRPVTIGREVTNGWIVEKGLKPGDRIVTEGVIKVKPGASVTIAEPRDSARTKAAQR
jgi:membrane fusion protein (multidrug efflux system)